MGDARPIICLDFDGVVHSYGSGWKGPRTIPDPPVPGALRFIELAQQAGFRVAIFSSRSRYWFGRAAMKAWLERHAIDHFGVDRVGADDFMCSLSWPTHKPPALVTIDDRAIAFDGTFPDPASLREFRPWNRPGSARKDH